MKTQKIIAVCLLISACNVHAQTITTIAGNGTMGYSGDGTPATNSKLNLTAAGLVDGDGGIAVDASGNVYIADAGNNVIRRINTAGIISTFAGNSSGMSGYSGDGAAATVAKLNAPSGVCIDGVGNVYIADAGNFVIRKVGTSGIISTYAGTNAYGYSGDGGLATAAKLSYLGGIAIDGVDNLYIADEYNNVIRRVSSGGIISTFAGNSSGISGYSGDGSSATLAKLNSPAAVAVDGSGNVYIADALNYVIRKVSSLGVISTFAGTDTSGYSGDGSAATAKELSTPTGIAVDGLGNVYIADSWNRVIRNVNTSGIITTYAGTDTVVGYSISSGPATAAAFDLPTGVAVDGSGRVYVSDIYNNVIWRIASSTTNTVVLNAPPGLLSVYPNPVGESFTVTISSEHTEQVQIVIANVIGQKMKDITAITNTPIHVSFSAQPGVYFLSATTALEKWSAEIIK